MKRGALAELSGISIEGGALSTSVHPLPHGAQS